jgi:REP element-mobilizing transposase RayT
MSSEPKLTRGKLQFQGAVFYATIRGNRDQQIFLSRADFVKFLQLLGECTNGRMRVYAYCLMPNHVHLLLEQSDNYSLSKFMQRIQTSYVKYYNPKYRKRGHLFEGHYQAMLIDPDVYLNDLVRYIQLNPVRSKVVKLLDKYPWTSHGQYLRHVPNPPAPVAVTKLLSSLPNGEEKGRQAYQTFIKAGLKQRHRKELYKGGAILGSEEFIKKVYGKADIERAVRPKVEKDLPGLWRTLLKREGLNAEPRGRKRSSLLEETAYFAVNFMGIGQSELAKYFQMDQSGISRSIMRLEAKWANKPETKEEYFRWVKSLEKPSDEKMAEAVPVDG